MRAELGAQVDDLKFTCARTDDISSNEGAAITISAEVVSLGYVKKFNVSIGYVKSISA